MRNIFFIVVFLFTMVLPAVSQQAYYWYNGQKIFLEPASSRVAFRLTLPDQAIDQKLSDAGLASRGVVGKDHDIIVAEKVESGTGGGGRATENKDQYVQGLSFLPHCAECG